MIASSLGSNGLTLRAACAQDDFVLPDATLLTLDAPIAAVTLYTERAMITRSCVLPREQGLFEIRIENLPHSIDGDSLNATVDGGKLLDVRFERIVTPVDVTTNLPLREAMAALETAQRMAATQALRMAKLSDENALINAISAKTATESAKDFGSKSLDPEALGKQLIFLDEARERLITARITLETEARVTADGVMALAAKVKALGGASKVARNAVVTVGKSSVGSATLSIKYLVDGAGWEPEYAVRAMDTGDDATDQLTLEYNARVSQSTGEDWSAVAMTLSTAAPTRNPSPPEVLPLTLTVFVPEPPADKSRGMERGSDRDASLAFKNDGAKLGRSGGMGGGGAGGFIGDAGEDPHRLDDSEVRLGIEFERTFADAQAEGSVVVNYTLPRKVTVPSDATRENTQRIATVELKPAFTHAARPIVDPIVYLRAKTRNTSNYRFLAGTARLFVGDDSVGVTEFPTVSAGADMTFWFGGDPRLTVARTLIAQETKEEGVFGKEAVTSWKWRVDFTSSANGASRIELTDRIPVSRNAEIKVELKDLSMPLSTDAEYLKTNRPQGILQWAFDMPGLTNTGKPSTQSISWTVRQAHGKNITIIESEMEEQ